MALGDETSTEFSLSWGNDNEKPVTPSPGQVWLSVDIEKFFISYGGGIWKEFNPISADENGTLLFNGSPIIPVSNTKSGSESAVTGQDWYEHLAGQIGYMTQADYVSPANGFAIGMRMTDADGNIKDEWTFQQSGRNGSISADILQRFAKTKTTDKLYVRNQRFTTSGAVVLTYSETAAFLRV